MPDFAYYALASAVGLATLSVISKSLVRYRVCDSGLITWGIGMMAGLISGLFLVIRGVAFPSQAVWHLLGTVIAVQLARWLTNRAIQEGDLSTVVPLMGVKIPMAAAMAFVLLGESHGLNVYAAVALACGGVALFGIGRPERAQGGHDAHPVVPILFACGGAASFALSDQFTKLGLDRSSVVQFVTWAVTVRGVLCAAMFVRPKYRKYRIAGKDWALFAAGGALTVAVIACLATAFRLADGVAVVNVLLGARGLFGLLLGATLGKLLSVPIERQPARIYVLRSLGMLMLLAAVLMALAG